VECATYGHALSALNVFVRKKNGKKFTKEKNMKVAFVFLPPWDPHYPSYAVALFKASTRAAGYEFIDFDLNVDMYRMASEEDKKLWDGQVANQWKTKYDEIIHKYSGYINSFIENITAMGINLFAISINDYSKQFAFYISQRIKEEIPTAKILFGGPQCFPAYDGIYILENKYVDAICTGEGDLIWPKVLDYFQIYRNLQIDIPGIAYKKDDGTIVDNGVPELVNYLNSIPFADYSDIDFEKYGSQYFFSIMTSRGCINKCAFCSERPNFYRYRFRSAENIFNEIVKHLLDLQNNPSVPSNRGIVPYISFIDSLINGNPKELEKFCDLVIDSGHTFIWGGMALIRTEMTRDLLFKMKKAGCHNLAWGLESGCQEVLDLMHKSFFNMELAKKVIKLVHEIGISQSISLIAGFPGETDEMFQTTKEFIAEYKEYFVVGVQPMMVVRNSLVYDRSEDFGIVDKNDWLEWQTLDGTNTYEIRLQRVEILRSVLEGKLKTIDKESKKQLLNSQTDFVKEAYKISFKKLIGSRLNNQAKLRIRKCLGLFGIRV
jgi:anaerobic magnesium-protoporphyrin IX monomethyl ester cyclase